MARGCRKLSTAALHESLLMNMTERKRGAKSLHAPIKTFFHLRRRLVFKGFSTKMLTEQIVANRGSLNWFGDRAGGGASNYTRGEYRQKLTFGPSDIFDIRLCYGNYFSNGGQGEFAGFNPITVEAGIELAEPALTVMATWQGAKAITIQPGCQVISDPIPVNIPAGGFAWLRTGVIVSPGEVWPTAQYFYGLPGDTFIESTSASTQVSGTGPMTVPSGGIVAPSSTGFSAIAILGIPRIKIRSGIIVGDSISVGVADDADGNGNHGFISRGFSNNQIPYAKLGRQSETLRNQAGPAGYLRRTFFRYGTIAITNAGTNDISAERTLSQLQADLTTLWAALKARGLKVHHVLLFPRTTSTDAFATPSNQTYFSAAYAPGALRDQLNVWVRTQVGTLIDGYFDPAPYIEDVANPGKWASVASPAALPVTKGGLTTDGTHPNELCSMTLTMPFTTYLSAL